MSKSIEAQVTSEAPEEAFGYRLEVPGNKPHSTKVVPRPTRSQRAEGTPAFWRLRPFQAPRGVGEGTFRIRYCALDGREVEPREGAVLPVVKIAWQAAVAPPTPTPTPAAPPSLPQRELDIELADKERNLQFEDKEQESNLKVGAIGHRLSLLRADRAHRDLVTESAEREMATAGRVSSMTQQLAVGHLQLVEAVHKLTQQITAPPAVVTTDWGKPLTQLIDSVTSFGMALMMSGDGDEPPRLPGKKKPSDDEPTPERGERGGSEEVDEEPPPAAEDEPAPTVPTGAETYAAFAGAHLTEEERRRMDEAMRDPERVREFLKRIRKDEEASHAKP